MLEAMERTEGWWCTSMADACVCSDKLYVDDTGRLCIVEGAMGLQAILVYTATGTFDKATYPWLARVQVIVVAGGAGGGGAPAHTATEVSAGGGGGGGGAAETVVDGPSLVASETVTIGAGSAGVSAASAAAGGTSSFGAHAVATGGAGGTSGVPQGATFNVGASGSGGVGTVGDVLYQGGDGQEGIMRGPDTENVAIGGAGGGSLLLRNRENIPIGATNPAGLDAWLQNKGQGGFGAASEFSQGGGAHRGSDGSAGLVVVRLYA